MQPRNCNEVGGARVDQDVKTSRVDRGYTDYSEEYALQEINKIDYEL